MRESSSRQPVGGQCTDRADTDQRLERMTPVGPNRVPSHSHQNHITPRQTSRGLSVESNEAEDAVRPIEDDPEPAAEPLD